MMPAPRWVNRLFARQMNTLSDRVLVVSDAVRRHWVSILPALDEKIVVVHNAIRPEPFDIATVGTIRRELRIPDEVAVIIVLGRIHHMKGHDVFLQALATLKASTTQPYRALIVGDVFSGYERLRRGLALRIRDLGLARDVVLLGCRHDVPELLIDSDLVVVPSTGPDSFPTVILEAMAAAKPVIATTTGGAVELIDDARSGFLVPPGDPQTLAAQLGLLLADAGLRRRLGRAGRARLDRLFSFDRFARELRRAVLPEILPRQNGTEQAGS
jgi:glycosyltransferase involved in cell wall biosynthesis